MSSLESLLAADTYGLFAAVLVEPEDWPRRLILADWLEECGEVMGAEAMRWMARNKKRPQEGGKTIRSWFDIIYMEHCSNSSMDPK